MHVAVLLKSLWMKKEQQYHLDIMTKYTKALDLFLIFSKAKAIVKILTANLIFFIKIELIKQKQI